MSHLQALVCKGCSSQATLSVLLLQADGRHKAQHCASKLWLPFETGVMLPHLTLSPSGPAGLLKSYQSTRGGYCPLWQNPVSHQWRGHCLAVVQKAL